MSTAADKTGSRTNGADAGDAEVIAAIHRLLPRNPSIGAVADSLSISVRTLQRRLARGPLTYRQLLDRCRRRQAEQELRQRGLTIAEISQHLGYSDPAHFVRAFRRWAGEAPTRFRAGFGLKDTSTRGVEPTRAEKPGA
jgi:AraC-like DNA-binding protein